MERGSTPEPDDGWTDLEAEGTRIRIRPELEGWARDQLGDGTRLRDWAARQEDRDARQGGRGPLHFVPAPVGSGRWAVRPFRRGGAIAPVLGDRYLALGTPRAVREAEVSDEARRRGVPTPRVVVAAVYPAGLFRRSDLATEVIEGASELAGVLFPVGGRPGDRPVGFQALEATGELIRTLADAGLDHPDLNARNILLTPGDAGSGPEGSARLEGWVIDLDRATVGAPLDPHAMLARLERSMRKIGRERGAPPREETFAVLRSATLGERP